MSTAVALANLDVFEKEKLLDNVRANEGPSARRWRSCATCRSSATYAATATSTASSWSRTRTTKLTFDDDESERLLRGFLSHALFDAGLVCRADDRGDPVIQLAPPLICGPEHFDEIERVLRAVLTEAWTKI